MQVFPILRANSRRGALLALAWPALAVACATGVHAADEADQCASLEPQVRTLLQAMSTNAQLVDYSGVVTLQRGGDMQIMSLSHRVENGRATEELSRLTGQDARVERSGHPTDCMHPGHQLLRANQEGATNVCELSHVYSFRVGPGERVAGRDALRLRVQPRDMYRFGYVFELDRDTALMLKSTTISADQRVLEQFQFASLTMQAGDSSAAAVEHAAKHPHPHVKEVSAQTNAPAWKPQWLPAGFQATDAALSTSGRKSYTDGFASFSVFVEPLGTVLKPGEGVERQGSTVAYTRGVVLRQRPILVTIVGEIPTNTARMVADSVRLN